MTTDYRALCAELLQELDHASAWDYQQALKDQARAALAQPEPEGPTDEELRQVLLDCGYHPENRHLTALARAVLARWGRPAIEPKVTKEDVLDWLRQDRAWGTVIAPTMWRRPEDDELLDLLQRAIVRFGRPAITPIPVSERLPGPEDCDAEGTCWMWHPVNFHYCLCRPDPSVHTHWLPAHALPLPRQPD